MPIRSRRAGRRMGMNAGRRTMQVWPEALAQAPLARSHARAIRAPSAVSWPPGLGLQFVGQRAATGSG